MWYELPINANIAKKIGPSSRRPPNWKNQMTMLNLFRKKETKKKAKDHINKLAVLEIVRETADTTTMVFRKPEDGFDYAPGQFLTLIIPVGGEEVRRPYSISTSPHTDENIAVTVKRLDKGTVSNYLNDHMKIGDEYEVLLPMGSFTPALSADNEKHYVLIGGGSGITPLISIIKSILAVEANSTLLLIYQNRDEASIIFKDQLEKLESNYGGRLKLVNILSKPGASWDGLQGRLDGKLIREVLADQIGNKGLEAEYFICGPGGLMVSVENALNEMGVSADRVHKESFSTPAPKNVDDLIDTDVAINKQEVTIILDGMEHRVTVEPGKSILEAALNEDIDMPFSCQSGLCTACRGKLLSGKVYMEEDEGLSDDEKQEGYVLNCVGHPLSENVVIEIG